MICRSEGGAVVGKGIEPRPSVPARARLRLEHASANGRGADVPVLRLGGELDFATVPDVDRFLRRRLGPFYERRTLVMDLRDVTLVDSSFISFVVSLGGGQRPGRGELVLAGPVGQVRTLLCMVGLPNLVPVYASLDEALGAAREARASLIPPAFSATG
jgi:anti-anti-sigma factor